MNFTKLTPLFLLYFFCMIFSVDAREAAVPERITYSISPKRIDGEQHLEVHLTFQAGAKNSTYLILPYQCGGQTNLHQQIRALKCVNPLVSIEATEEAAIKRIRHAPNQTIEIRYLVQSGKYQETEEFKDWYHRPIIKNDYFLCFGQALFVIPLIDTTPTKIPNIEKPVHICLEWNNFPDEWTVANSYGAQAHRQELDLPILNLVQAVYCAGDFNLISIGDAKAPIYVAIRDKWSFSIDRLSQLLQTIIQGQRSFWEDEKFPYYLVTVMPSGNGGYISGTALNNSFAVFLNDFEDNSYPNWNDLTYLLSHEHFHTWNGNKMAPSDLDKMQWFVEGFTDYYAIELIYRMHLFGVEDYLDRVNNNLYDFYANPERNAKNRKIGGKFWKDFNYLRLPYVRGFALALNWNKQIQKKSKNAYSLDDFMHGLYKKVQKSGKPFSINDIQSVAGKYLGKEAVAYDLKHYIINGETIPMEEQALEGLAVVEWIEDVGFNIKLSDRYRTIIGVFEGSEAHQAGLRNGQNFVSYTSTRNKIKVTISEEGQGTKTVEYTLDGQIEYIPQFTSSQSIGAIAA